MNSTATEVAFAPLALKHLDAVMAIEERAHAHPWSRGNFLDSINVGYECQVLMADTQLLGYFVVMLGVDEAHLLNLTVAPEHQRQGWARVLLDAMVIWARGRGARTLWLEVRVGNQRAREVYVARGFRSVALRRGYYPNAQGPREDAVVMCLTL